ESDKDELLSRAPAAGSINTSRHVASFSFRKGKIVQMSPEGRATDPNRRTRAVILLIGPGGAGKTTTGRELALRLAVPFIDLDEQFTKRHGNISGYLASYGYQSYAGRNVELYLDLYKDISTEAVFALSSGFMTYDKPHPEYESICRQ